MALATQCPHCGTMFRVASDQLKLRGGIVRCGACQEIFDGSATLVDLDKLPAKPAAAPAALSAAPPADSSLPVDAAPAQADAPADDALPFTIVEPERGTDTDTPAPQALPDQPAFDDQPVYTLDFDHTFDPLGILPKVASPGADSDTAEVPSADTPAEAVSDTVSSAQQPEMLDAASAPAAGPATAADSDIDALSLLQPWSRTPSGADGEAQPASIADAPATLEAASAVSASLEATALADKPAALPARTPQAAHAPPAPGGIGRIEPALGLPVDEELVAAPLPGHEPEPMSERASEPAMGAAPRLRPRAGDAPPLLTRESAASIPPAAPVVPGLPPIARTPAAKRAEKAAARRSKLTPTKIEPLPKLRVADIDEPEFVRRSRHQEQLGRTRKIAMLAGSLVLLLVLIAQGLATFRDVLAARFPAAKPMLVTGCALFGCRVELLAQVDKLAIETGELTTLGGGAYSFTTELRNGGATVQAWPSLELTLIDANGRPLVRRVFPPRDYLAADTLPANGMAPGAAQPIKLHFRVDDLKPSGYHIAVFYP